MTGSWEADTVEVTRGMEVTINISAIHMNRSYLLCHPPLAKVNLAHAIIQPSIGVQTRTNSNPSDSLTIRAQDTSGREMHVRCGSIHD